MKEAIKLKLEKYDFKYSEKKNILNVKFGHSQEICIDFSNPEKIIIKDKLVSWNFLTGVIEMSLKATMVFNTIGLLIIATMFALFDIPNASFYFTFLFGLVAIWTLYYLVRSENFKKMLINWIEHSK
ncbi:MAG TPA: hypothetical protein DCQ31_05220 [Bacteroidales bacterium]|nr:hypothetical protein [Bacteroidales bacterium]